MIVLTKLRLALYFVLALILFLVPSLAQAKYDNRQVECLVKNTYFEARGEPKKGQLAVIFTTLNRASSDMYPKDLCKVVYQRNQFSWTAKRDHSIKDKESYTSIKETVHEVLQGKHKDVSNGALSFHATSIKKPKDFGDVKCTARIGGHIFYKPSK